MWFLLQKPSFARPSSKKNAVLYGEVKANFSMASLLNKSLPYEINYNLCYRKRKKKSQKKGALVKKLKDVQEKKESLARTKHSFI